MSEMELASWDDGMADPAAAEHLRWCRRCQNAVGSYRWLQEEIASALAATAKAVPVPRPRWRRLQYRLRDGQTQLAAAWRLSAITGITLLACLLLAASSIPASAVVACELPREAIRAPSPVPAATLRYDRASAVTPVRVWSGEATEASLTPALVLHPAPSAAETATGVP